MTDWKNWTPQYDGHAPVDWVDGCEWEYSHAETGPRPHWFTGKRPPFWEQGLRYRYHPMQDATHEPDLLAQCLALPQDQREALIEAMQKPQRDWADDVAQAIWQEYIGCNFGTEKISAVIRSMCRPKEELQHVAYYDEGKFHWMSGIAPRDCELFAKREALS